MPNTSLPSQPQMPGRYSGYEAAPAEYVLFEQPRTIESQQPTHEVFPAPVTEQAPRALKVGIPLTIVGREAQPNLSSPQVAERALYVSGTIVTDLRPRAVAQIMNEQGLRRAA